MTLMQWLALTFVVAWVVMLGAVYVRLIYPARPHDWQKGRG